QIDTYFHAPHGRLKLREINGRERCELIAYSRPNNTAARASDYLVVPVPHPAALKAALSSALGIRGEVRKRRELLLWHNVRIHLDDVASLGTFVEFEAVISSADDEAASRSRLQTLYEAVRIREAHLIAESYSDLLLR